MILHVNTTRRVTLWSWSCGRGKFDIFLVNRRPSDLSTDVTAERLDTLFNRRCVGIFNVSAKTIEELESLK